MERIKSFCVDHTKLKKGVYISRVDDTLITYDIRMCEPNVDTPLDPKAAHTIEHIGATLLRNGKYADKIIYFGPMGCMTGFYLIIKDLSLKQSLMSSKKCFKKLPAGTRKFQVQKKKSAEIIHTWILKKLKNPANSLSIPIGNMNTIYCKSIGGSL